MKGTIGMIYDQIADENYDVEIEIDEREGVPQLYITVPIRITVLGEPEPVVEKMTACVYVDAEGAALLEEAARKLKATQD